MLIEFHDNEVLDIRGTLTSMVGRDGFVDYAYQAEEWVREIMTIGKPSIVRAYVLGYCKVYAIWKKDAEGNLYYVARNPEYDGKWELPYAYETTTMVTAVLGREVVSVDDGTRWASEKLLEENVACAVLLDENGVITAWEMGPEGPTIVAQTPRPMPIPNAATICI